MLRNTLEGLPQTSALDTKIDIMTDSVSTIMQKMLNKAYGGEFPKGGLEVPAVVAMGKSLNDRADYTISPNIRNEEKTFSFDSRLVPPIMKQEPTPRKSEQPFDSPFMEMTPKGVFGKALVAHSKLVSVYRSMNQDTAPIVRNFRQMWGIAEDVDLEQFYSKPRSEGPALWGGLKRNPVPTVLVAPGAQAQVNIIDHGTQREQIGKNALVDWPRMKSIAMAVGIQLAIDDDIYRDNPQDLKMVIVKSEVPTAPTEISVPEFVDIQRDEVKLTRSEILNISGQMRKIAAIKAQSLKHVEMSEIEPKDIVRAVRAIPTGLHVAPDVNIFQEFVEWNPLSTDSIKQPAKQEVVKRVLKAKPVDLIKGAAIAYADKNRGNLIRAREIRKMIVDLDIHPQVAFSKLHKLINDVLPTDFLVRVFHMGNMTGEQRGIKWVNEMRHLLDMSHVVYTERDLKESWIRSVKNHKVAERVADEIATGFSTYELAAKGSIRVTVTVQRMLADSQTFMQGVDRIIHQHAVYWHNRYKNKPAKNKDEVITNQILAKSIRRIKLKFTKDMMVTESVPEMKAVLIESADAFIQKRATRHKCTYMKPPSLPYVTELAEVGRELDNFCKIHAKKKPKPTYTSLSDKILIDAALFVEDIQNFLDKVYTIEPIDMPEDYATQTFDDSATQPQILAPKPMFTVDLKPLQKSEEPKPPAKTRLGLGLGLGSLMSKPLQKADQTVDVKSELGEEGVNINAPGMQHILARHPARIDYKQFAALKVQILSEHAKMQQDLQSNKREVLEPAPEKSRDYDSDDDF